MERARKMANTEQSKRLKGIEELGSSGIETSDRSKVLIKIGMKIYG